VVSGNTNTADIDDFTTPTYTSILSTDITVPKNGFLMIVGSSSSGDDATLVGTGRLALRLRLDDTPAWEESAANLFNFISGQAAGDDEVEGLTATVPVTKGAHTVHIDVREEAAGSYIYARSLSVLFVPKGTAPPIPVAKALKGSQGDQNQ